MKQLPVRVHTILFTEECPLDCRYCHLKSFDTYKKAKPMTKEEIFAAIDKIDKENPAEEISSRLLLTGGEPFLYWDIIAEILKKYDKRFTYEFNTSGYLLTPDRIRFLSNYPVHFVLSVDGDERLTNYLRPLHNGNVGYFKEFKKNIKTLLYYFPNTAFKCIINPRYVDLLYSTYQTAEKLGFLYFNPILDFNSRGKWTEEKKKELYSQYKKIITSFILGFKENVVRPQIKNINFAISTIVNPNFKNPKGKDLRCQVFNGRTNQTLNNKSCGYCMSAYFPDIKQAEKEFDMSDLGFCKNDKKCDAYNFCSVVSCPKNSLDLCGKFRYIDELECLLNKVEYEMAKIILDIGIDFLEENRLFQKYLKKVGENETNG